VFIPFRAEDFPKWAGASFDEFIATLPTGRIVPVFAHNPERYEAALISKIVDAGTPRVVLNGEMTLRTIGSFVNEHPLVPFLHTDRSGVRDLRAKVEEVGDSRLGVALGYIDAVTDIVDHLGGLAVSGPSLSMGWQPVANWLIGELAERFGFPSVELEMGVAIDHQLKTRAIGGRPMSQMGSNSAELGFSHHFHFAVTSGPTASILDRQLRATIRSRGYSMTSSASAKSVGGILRLRVLAVLRLITSSNRVGCSTGRSAGLAPFRIRLT